MNDVVNVPFPPQKCTVYSNPNYSLWLKTGWRAQPFHKLTAKTTWNYCSILSMIHKQWVSQDLQREIKVAAAWMKMFFRPCFGSYAVLCLRAWPRASAPTKSQYSQTPRSARCIHDTSKIAKTAHLFLSCLDTWKMNVKLNRDDRWKTRTEKCCWSPGSSSQNCRLCLLKSVLMQTVAAVTSCNFRMWW